MTQWYAQVNPASPFAGVGRHGPLLEIVLASVNGDWAEVYSGSTGRRVKVNEKQNTSSDPFLLPEPLVRELYERLQTYYGGVPNSSVERVLQEALTTERDRVDRVLDSVVLRD